MGFNSGFKGLIGLWVGPEAGLEKTTISPPVGIRTSYRPPRILYYIDFPTPALYETHALLLTMEMMMAHLIR